MYDRELRLMDIEIASDEPDIINSKNHQYIMVHSEIVVTMDTYTHLKFEEARSDYLS